METTLRNSIESIKAYGKQIAQTGLAKCNTTTAFNAGATDAIAGKANSPTLPLTVELATPAETDDALTKYAATLWNQEQLFKQGYNEFYKENYDQGYNGLNVKVSRTNLGTNWVPYYVIDGDYTDRYAISASLNLTQLSNYDGIEVNFSLNSSDSSVLYPRGYLGAETIEVAYDMYNETSIWGIKDLLYINGSYNYSSNIDSIQITGWYTYGDLLDALKNELAITNNKSLKVLVYLLEHYSFGYRSTSNKYTYLNLNSTIVSNSLMFFINKDSYGTSWIYDYNSVYEQYYYDIQYKLNYTIESAPTLSQYNIYDKNNQKVATVTSPTGETTLSYTTGSDPSYLEIDPLEYLIDQGYIYTEPFKALYNKNKELNGGSYIIPNGTFKVVYTK